MANSIKNNGLLKYWYLAIPLVICFILMLAGKDFSWGIVGVIYCMIIAMIARWKDDKQKK